jgi:hypothetical protein
MERFRSRGRKRRIPLSVLRHRSLRSPRAGVLFKQRPALNALLLIDARGLGIFYSHANPRELEEVRLHLEVSNRISPINFWDDTQLVPGEMWRERIETELASVRGALLLISQHLAPIGRCGNCARMIGRKSLYGAPTQFAIALRTDRRFLMP